MVDIKFLTEEYLNNLGYYKISDDGQYGVYNSLHCKTKSLTYGLIPKDYRTIRFNRDEKYGIFFSLQSDWETRYSLKNVLATNQQIFETLLNASI